jgi:CDP-glycerol glycerophosphotransferase
MNLLWRLLCGKMYQKVKNLIKTQIILRIYGFFRKLPINSDLILFESNTGRNYSGNPKYIYEEMVRQGLDHTLRCVWILEDPTIEIPGHAKKVKKSRMMYYYYIARAEIWIFDAREPSDIHKRKQVYYIQTWHGTPLKKLGMDMDDVFMSGSVDIETYKRNMYRDTRKWDFLLSQNDFSTEIFKSAFAFNQASIWTYGYPRNDILSTNNNEEDINKIKSDLGIPTDKKVLLYAPTWRDNEYHERSIYKFVTAMDFDLLKEKLSDEYIVIVKFHYLVVDDIDWSNYKDFIYNIGADTDIAHLYLVSDMLITDYSSVMFDYSILNRPMFFFMYDLETYRDELRGFYPGILDGIPGPISKTTRDLIKDIEEYDHSVYEEKYRTFRDKFNKYDDGHASQRIVERILELKDK